MRADSDRLSQNEWSGPIFIYSLRRGSEQAFTCILVTLRVSDARVAYIIYITLYDCSPYIRRIQSRFSQCSS